VDRAGLLAHAAEDAAQLVDREAFGILLAIGPRAFHADDVDAVGRTGRRAEEASDALDAPLLVLVEPVDAAIDQRVVDRRTDFGEAHGALRAKEMFGGGR